MKLKNFCTYVFNVDIIIYIFIFNAKTKTYLTHNLMRESYYSYLCTEIFMQLHEFKLNKFLF